MSNHDKRHAALKTITGTDGPYEADWHAFFDVEGIGTGTYNERLLKWLNQKNSASDTSLPSAMLRYAVSEGYTSWNELITVSQIAARLLEDGTTRLLEDGTTRTLES